MGARPSKHSRVPELPPQLIVAILEMAFGRHGVGGVEGALIFCAVMFSHPLLAAAAASRESDELWYLFLTNTVDPERWIYSHFCAQGGLAPGDFPANVIDGRQLSVYKLRAEECGSWLQLYRVLKLRAKATEPERRREREALTRRHRADAAAAAAAARWLDDTARLSLLAAMSPFMYTVDAAVAPPVRLPAVAELQRHTTSRQERRHRERAAAKRGARYRRNPDRARQDAVCLAAWRCFRATERAIVVASQALRALSWIVRGW